jgi:hypothetical protein
MLTYKVQSGDMSNGKWTQGSFEETIFARDIADARQQALVIAKTRSTGFEVGSAIRVVGNGECTWRPFGDDEGPIWS